MKGNWKKIAAGGVSISLAVALLATSLTSHKPVQAVDVFSETKELVKASDSDTFDIVELISEKSSFPTVEFNEYGEFVQIPRDPVSKQVAITIGNEELAYMVGGQEPFTKFWEDMVKASWMVADSDQLIDINSTKDSFIDHLIGAGLLDRNDLYGYPLRIVIGENVNIPEKILNLNDYKSDADGTDIDSGDSETNQDTFKAVYNNAFLEVMPYGSDPSNTEIIGYYIPSVTFGCYAWEDNSMKYVGSRMAGKGAVQLNYLGGWSSSYIGDMESEEYSDAEYDYESEYEFWDEYESEYDYDNEEEYSYDQQYQNHEEEYDYTYIEEEDTTGDRTVEYFYPDEGYSQSTVEVEIPTYNAGLILATNSLDAPNDGGDNEEEIVGKEGVVYNFYSVEEEKKLRESLKLENDDDNILLDEIPVYGNNVGDLRTFRYISLENNEWLKTQVFGIEESVNDQPIKYTDYKIQVASVTADEFEDALKESVKLLYIAQLPGVDISKDLRNDILSRVANNKMDCIVNDANIHTILGTTIDSDYPILQNLVTYLYQSDLAGYLYYKPDPSQENRIMYTVEDKTPVLEEGDRVNVVDIVDEDGNVIDDVAHFVHKNVYAIDRSFVNSDVKLYDAITQGVDEGFDEVQYRIEQENYHREQLSQMNGSPFEKIGDVTRALAIQYILTYTDVDWKFAKAGIRVLELQPCYDFTYAPMEYLHNGVTVSGRGKEARITAFMRDILGMDEDKIKKTPAYYREKGYNTEAEIEQAALNEGVTEISWFEVEIVGMSTSEFCAKIEDINVEYDLIYWGSNTGTLNHCVGADGKEYTVYNDYDMIGNAYTHVGDVGFRNDDDQILGIFGSESKQSNENKYMGWTGGGSSNAELSKFYRNSGNDILANQVDKLISFLDAGYPIIVDDAFFVNDIASVPQYTFENISCSDEILTTVASLKSVGYTNDNALLDLSKAENSKDVYGILDTSTYIYQFMNQILSEKYVYADAQRNSLVETGKYKNFMAVSQVSTNKDDFNVALNKPKIRINLISQPIKYSYTTKSVAGVDVIDSANYLVTDGNGKTYLEYEFYISNASGMESIGTSYEALLYVDANMDGKYVDSELMTLSDVVNLDIGQVESSSTLQNGTHYQIRRELPQEYIGAVPWELKIVDNANHNVRGAVTGLCAVKEQKRELYICQFVQNRGSDAALTYIGDNTISGWGGRGTRKPVWTNLLQAVPDFNIHIISVDAAQYFSTNGAPDDETLRRTYNTLPANNPYNPNKEYTPGEVFDPTLEGYDMLLFGFVEGLMESKSTSDGGDFGNAQNVGRVMSFIQEGKSVVFTHDSTAIFNTAGNNNSFNMLVRDMGGLDRYGITIGKGNYQPVTGTDGNKSEEELRYEKEKKYFNLKLFSSGVKAYNTKAELENAIFMPTDPATGEVIDMRDYKRDIAFKPGSNQTAMVSETISLTSGGWEGRPNGTVPFYYLSRDYRTTKTEKSGKYGYGNPGTADCKVAKINNGAITEYPYKLDDLISVDRTHSQYYQLDFETDKDYDGEGDLVVWYTLDNYHPKELDAFNITHGNARDNYYIYTKDNVTYSGSGNYEVVREDEIKLFINTMVAAYRVGTKAPDINLIGDPSIMSIKTADSIPYDPELSNVSPYYPVYFQIKDNNIISDQNKFVFYKAYLVDKNGTQINIGTAGRPQYITAKDITVDVNNNNGEGYVLYDGPATDKAVLPYQKSTTDMNWKNKVIYVQDNYSSKGIIVENENVYRIDLPISLFNSTDAIELYIEGSSVVVKKDSSSPENMTLKESEPMYTKFTISKMQLFDMD